MDRFNQTDDRTFLLKLRDLYRQAFEAFPSDYHTGHRRRVEKLGLGRKGELAKRAQDLVGDNAVAGDYMKNVTVAQVHLLRGDFDKAARIYVAAVLAAPFDRGSHESNCGETQELLDALGATPEQKARIAAASPQIAAKRSDLSP
jgi:hypothetical protein